MLITLVVLLTIASIALRISIGSLEVMYAVGVRADAARRGLETTALMKTEKGSTARKVGIGSKLVVDSAFTVANKGFKSIKTVSIKAMRATIKGIRFIVSRIRDLLLSLSITVLVIDIIVFIILASASAGFLVLYCTTDDNGNIVMNEEVISSLAHSSSGSEEDAENHPREGVGDFTKYDLSDEEIMKLARLCRQEQGSNKGIAAEASIMANLYESPRGSKYNSLYDYVRNCGWFAKAAHHMDNGSASDDQIKIVKAVLKDGKRVLPKYVDEHDWFPNDIASAKNNSGAINKADRSAYVQHETLMSNIYGATYYFYCFPTETSDPFGYISQEKRTEMGDDCYKVESLLLELGLE